MRVSSRSLLFRVKRVKDILGNLQQALGNWARSASDSRWLNADAAQSIGEAEIATPGSLFDASQRPLVIALFGGTGVGKSTLLNRLAQSPIARASAERPTSRDITVYVHESVTVSRLPDEFPMAQMKTSIHQRAEWRNVMWVDMPDFDSVETGNRALVEQWLPHVDVVLYVVSPERYRDDEGWQLLLEHGRRHAWLFAMNHWDRGEQSQIDDFKQLLARAGLPDPMIFRTDSSGDPSGKSSGESSGESSIAPGAAANDGISDGSTAPGNDDFSDLETSIRELAEAQFITQLEERGVFQRLEELRQQGDSLQQRLGDPALMSALPEQWKAHWQRESSMLEKSLGWKIPTLAAQHARSQPGFFSGLLPRRSSLARRLLPGKIDALIGEPGTDDSKSDVSRDGDSGNEESRGGGSRNEISRNDGSRSDDSQTGSSQTVPGKSGSEASDQRRLKTANRSSTSDNSGLIDNSAVARIESSIERFLQDAVTSGALPMLIAQDKVSEVMGRLQGDLSEQVQDALNRSLAQPGTSLQRGSVKVLGWLSAVLPLAAMGWIGFRVVNGFVQGGSQPAQYLGSNFAINSAMLLALAWGVPALLRHRLMPSMERAAARGLQSGLERTFDEVDHRVRQQLEQAASEQQAMTNSYQALWSSDWPSSSEPSLPDRFRRLLLEPAEGVRANTQS